MKSRRLRVLGTLLVAGGITLMWTGAALKNRPLLHESATTIMWVRDSGATADRNPSVIADSSFLSTEIEVLQSELVLSNVVQDAQLKAAWASRFGAGSPFNYAEMMKILRSRLTIQRLPDSARVEIQATSEDADEAAKLANAVAGSYRAYYLRKDSDRTERSRQTIENRMRDQETQIQAAADKVDRLKKSLKVPDSAKEVNSPAEFGPYWEAQHDLKTKQGFLEVLERERETTYAPAGRNNGAHVEVTEAATPRRNADNVEQMRGAGMFNLGIMAIVGGIGCFAYSLRKRSDDFEPPEDAPRPARMPRRPISSGVLPRPPRR